MKKAKKQILVCSFIVVFLLTAAGFVSAAVKAEAEDLKRCYEINDSTEMSAEAKENQYQAIQAYTGLLNSFKAAAETSSKADDPYLYRVDGMQAKDFPAYYGGAYVNKEGNLVVQIAYREGSLRFNRAAEQVSKICGTQQLIFREAKHSYSELIDTMSALLEYCDSEKYQNSGVRIVGFEISEDKNAITVSIDSNDAAAEEEIRQSIGKKDLLIFEYQECGEELTYSLDCGSEIGMSTASLGFSAGYPAFHTTAAGNKIKGFVTCGHAFDTISNSASIYCFSGYIGNLDTTRKQHSGSIDAAFITLNGSQVTTNVRSTNISVVLTGYTTPPAGSTVYMTGKYSLHSSGLVLSTSHTSPANSGLPELTDMVKAAYSSIAGDSGGIVYARVGYQNYYIAGTQSRRASDGSYSVYCKVGNINTAFGINLD